MSTNFFNAIASDFNNLLNANETSETVTIIKGIGQQAQATANAYFDGVTPTALLSVSIVTAGSGYSVAPTVSFVGGGGSGGAAATATITAGAVTAITLSSAGLYVSAPKVVLSGGSTSYSAKAFIQRNNINQVSGASKTKSDELEVWILKDADLGLDAINIGTDKIILKPRLDKTAETKNIVAVLDECPAFWRLKVE